MTDLQWTDIRGRIKKVAPELDEAQVSAIANEMGSLMRAALDIGEGRAAEDLTRVMHVAQTYLDRKRKAIERL